jgi:hypothetical protein
MFLPQPWSMVFVWIYTCIYAYAMYECNIFSFTHGYISIHSICLINQHGSWIIFCRWYIYLDHLLISLFSHSHFTVKFTRPGLPGEMGGNRSGMHSNHFSCTTPSKDNKGQGAIIIHALCHFSSTNNMH